MKSKLSPASMRSAQDVSWCRLSTISASEEAACFNVSEVGLLLANSWSIEGKRLPDSTNVMDLECNCD